MERKEFLQKIGLGAAFVLTSTCLGSCSKDSDTAPDGPIDFTLDLSAPENSNLKNNGGYVINQGVVVARDDQGNYVAATQKCSHEGINEIILQDNEWFCTAHDARFDLNGTGLNNKGKKGLTIYNTNLNGKILHVFS